jgi:transcription elongation factor
MSSAAKLAKKALRKELLIPRWKIITGDKVQIIEGKDKGKVGVVKKCLRKQNRVIVEGINLVNTILFLADTINR